MKILFDESIPLWLRKVFPSSHDVFTVRYMGWLGVKNGALLSLIAENKFDCWVVVDKGIPYSQNIQALPCLLAILNAHSNKFEDLLSLMPQLLQALETSTGQKVLMIQ